MKIALFFKAAAIPEGARWMLQFLMKYMLDPAKVCQLYSGGLSATQVGETLGVSKTPIFRILREAGMSRRKIVISVEQKAQIVSLYLTGKSIDEIVKIAGISHNPVAAAIKKAAVARRKTSDYKNGWCREKEIDGLALAKDYASGDSIKTLARKIGVGFGTVQRRLIKVGVEIRPVSSVKTYLHESLSAGVIRVRGTWELFYARILDIWLSEGKIAKWSYEGAKIPVPAIGVGRYYLPDFVVTANDGSTSFHEVKGIIRDMAAQKIGIARASGLRVVLLRRSILYALFRHYKLQTTV